METRNISTNSEMLSSAKKVYELTHKNVNGILLIVNEKHRDSDQILVEISAKRPELSTALEETTKSLRSSKETDTDRFLLDSAIFTGQVSPFMRGERDLYTLFLPQAKVMQECLNADRSFSKIIENSPVGLGEVIPETKSGLHILADMFKSQKIRIKEDLGRAVGLSISFRKEGWPFAVSMKNLIEIGPVVAQTALDNSEALMNATSKQFPGDEPHMESIINKSKLILVEHRLANIAGFEVRVYGQLAKSPETDAARKKIFSEAVAFRDNLIGKHGKIKITPSLLRGFFYYKALQVKYGQSPEVWGNEIKNFDWKDIIPDSMKRHVLKENNMWIIK
jgi:hypothetical protein